MISLNWKITINTITEMTQKIATEKSKFFGSLKFCLTRKSAANLKIFCSQCGMHSVHLHGWSPRQWDNLTPKQMNKCENSSNTSGIVKLHLLTIDTILHYFKVNSVQEACAKCFAVHILKFEILQTKWRNKTSNSICEKLKNKSLMFLVSFFHVICKISNFNM